MTPAVGISENGGRGRNEFFAHRKASQLLQGKRKLANEKESTSPSCADTSRTQQGQRFIVESIVASSARNS